MTSENKKIIFFSNINGDFLKFSEILNKITMKSGNFDIIILLGKIFNLAKNFEGLEELKKFEKE